MTERIGTPLEESRDYYSKRRFDRPHAHNKELPPRKESEEEYEVFQGHDRDQYAAYVEAIHSSEARAKFEKICELCEVIHDAGGRALIVGGAVRDEILGIPSKDFDVEVYGLDTFELERIVSQFGAIKDVGRAFGILKLSDESGLDVDISIPRTDSKVAEGHRGFEVNVDPSMSITEAAKRRDFTFNALSKDPLTGEIFDPFGGIRDLKTRTLRVTDPERFRDDPLRLLRGAQFAGRFGLAVEPETLQLMREMAPSLKEISIERIREEWEKLLLRSLRPSMGLEVLNASGVIDELYPELAALRGTPHEFEWHPEGDVWVHTLMVVDGARDICRRNRLDEETSRAVMFAALCHDLGKPVTTAFVNGRIRSLAHDVVGVEPTKTFLERIGTRKKDIKKTQALTREHIWPTAMYLHQLNADRSKERVAPGAFRRLAVRLDPATIEELSYVVEADCLGVGPFLDPQNPHQFLLKTVDAYGLEAGRWLREQAELLGIYRDKPKPFVMGRDLIQMGYAPGAHFSTIIKRSSECVDRVGVSQEEVLRILLESKGDGELAIQSLTDRIARFNAVHPHEDLATPETEI